MKKMNWEKVNLKSILTAVAFVLLAISTMLLYNGYYSYKAQAEELTKEKQTLEQQSSDVAETPEITSEPVSDVDLSDVNQAIDEATKAANEVLQAKIDFDVMLNIPSSEKTEEHTARLAEVKSIAGKYFSNENYFSRWFLLDSDYDATWKTFVAQDASKTSVPVIWVCMSNEDGAIWAYIGATYNVEKQVFESPVIYMTTAGAYHQPYDSTTTEDPVLTNKNGEEFVQEVKDLLAEDGLEFPSPDDEFDPSQLGEIEIPDLSQEG